ncbi:MAG: hypothetical protein II180_06740 [Proteobacteria bacterium]|nr:hypothetical protein [Pseudomonadota bacterium]
MSFSLSSPFRRSGVLINVNYLDRALPGDRRNAVSTFFMPQSAPTFNYISSLWSKKISFWGNFLNFGHRNPRFFRLPVDKIQNTWRLTAQHTPFRISRMLRAYA